MLSQADFLTLIVILTLWYSFNPTPANAMPPSDKRAMPNMRYVLALKTMPPGAFFGIVWFVLYGLIALSLFYFWRDASSDSRYTVVLLLYIVNLFANKLYTPIFFGMQSPVGGLVVLLITLVSAGIILLYLGFVLGSSVSFWLFVPYVVWLLVAMGLHVKFMVVYMAIDDDEKTKVAVKEKIKF